MFTSLKYDYRLDRLVYQPINYANETKEEKKTNTERYQSLREVVKKEHER